jgi:uncharacterized protein (TIGR03066 family)
MRAVLGCAAVFGLAAGLAGGAPAQDKKDGGKIDPKKLVGKWEPADKKAPPMVVEFTADGKVSLAVGEAKAAGTYKLDGDKLEVSIKHGAEELKQTLVVRKLTDDELTTEDEKQKVETLRRWKK